MKIVEFPINCIQYFKNGDAQSSQDYVLITDDNKIYRNERLIQINGNYSLGYPKVSIISDELFLLVENEYYENKDFDGNNAWLINRSGEIVHSFFVGSPHRMIFAGSKIVMSYDEAQLDTGASFGTNGLAVFDLNGSCLFEYYRDTKRTDWIPMMENYAFLKKDDKTVYFMPICGGAGDFPIVELNLVDFTTKVLFYLVEKGDRYLKQLPHAFSKKEDKWYFLSRHVEDFTHSVIFELNEDKQLVEIGKCAYSVFPKGLPNGKFFIPFTGGSASGLKSQLVEI